MEESPATMPETACLHIQARDPGASRTVALSGSTVRLGRPPGCAVQLAEPGIPAEVGRLVRRGATWFLVPGEPTNLVQFHGQAVERPLPLSYGVPFRVGDCSLIL